MEIRTMCDDGLFNLTHSLFGRVSLPGASAYFEDFVSRISSR
jgi:hypothetical protein